ncbi:MAG: MXAN_6640 family putative metalloprotease [Candidatus Oleimicrobiaceae bacterium]
MTFRLALLGAPPASATTAALSEQGTPWSCPSSGEISFQTRAGKVLFTDSLLTQNGRFLILYSTSGGDAVPLGDEDGNMVPDFVQAVAEALEQSYAVEIEGLGFTPPPNLEPWRQPYGVRIRELGTTRGITVAQGRDPEAPVQHHLSSYMELDNDFVSPQEHLAVADAIRATAAHEFFHAIQLGYVSRLITVDGFFSELSALWMEEQVFPGLGDYRHYLGDFFTAPDIPLNAVSLTVPRIINHMYGACLFAFFLEERFGRDVIRQVWQRMVDEPALEAIHSVCRAHGSSFEEEFVRFSLWNYLTGARAVAGFGYKAAATFPEVATANDTLLGDYMERGGSAYFLTASYLPFRILEAGSFRIGIAGATPEHWLLAAVAAGPGDLRTFHAAPGQGITVDNLTPAHTLTVIACNVDRSVSLRMLYLKEKPEEYVVFVQRVITGEHPRSQAPFVVLSAHPNPFSQSVTFRVRREVRLPLLLQVVDVGGRTVDTVALSLPGTGVHEVTWQLAPPLTGAPGVYFCRFSCPSHMQTVKVTFCR